MKTPWRTERVGGGELPPRWKLLCSRIIEDRIYNRGLIELGTFELRCRACGVPFAIEAVVHERGGVPSKNLAQRRNCPRHLFSKRRYTAEELRAGADLV